MAATLQNIRRLHIRESSQASGRARKSPDGKITRIDPATMSAGQLKRRQEIARLKQIRGSLEELILLADAQDRLPRTENGHIPTRGAVRAEANQLLSQLRDVIEVQAETKAPPLTATPTATAKPATKAPATTSKSAEATNSAKVQLRLSKTLVRILIEFSKAGHSPNRITERSLWKDPGIRDAAAILGITPPQLKKMVSSQARKS